MSEKSEFNFMTCLSELNYSLRVFLTVLIARFFLNSGVLLLPKHCFNFGNQKR